MQPQQKETLLSKGDKEGFRIKKLRLLEGVILSLGSCPL
jgi:hypothetical protein